ncbi:MAG: MFS transporter, partial [Pseudomonadota bacterium]
SVWLVEEAGLPREWLPAALFGYGLTGVAANILSGPASGRLGVERTIAMGLSLSALGCLAMWLFPTPIWAGIGGLICMGWFWLMSMAPIQARLVRLAGERAPLALAFNSSALYVGMAIGSAVGGALYELEGVGTLPLYAACGIAAALFVFLASRLGEASVEARARGRRSARGRRERSGRRGRARLTGRRGEGEVGPAEGDAP